ncbi:MAG TPA: hypothetical protein VGO87_05515 [Acidimicrobiia bacterium]
MAALAAGLFVIVLPAGVLVAALVVNLHRSSPEPEKARLCFAADVTDPAAKPCFALEGTGYCERHRPLEQAS